MCDTFIALSEFTADGSVIFGKNSDREPNEAQTLIRIPRMEHPPGNFKTTFIAIPRVSQTNEMILSKPFHMWGAEMGVNEHGLVIGNEAVFTKVKPRKDNSGLTGMDMLRLALERTDTAERAAELITVLIEQYGQDACGGYTDKSFFYSNSFLIADPRQAYVLESAGRHWALAKVRGFRAISNGLTIDGEYDQASRDLVEHARQSGWIKKGKEFSFRECYSDWFYTYFSKCKIRQALSTTLGESARGKLDVASAMRMLRSHGAREKDGVFHPDRADMGALCVHASGITAPSQTTGSLVAQLRPDAPSTYYFTGTSAPCVSLFKPFFVPGTNIRQGDFLEPGARPDESLWWRGERLHRLTLGNYPQRTKRFLDKRDELEKEFLARERELDRADAATRNDFSNECLKRGDEALEAWRADLEQAQDSRRFAPFYSLYRARLDRAAGL